MVNGGAVRSWFSAAKQRADAADLAGDQAKSVSLKRSANGRVNQAAGLCAPKALDWYKSQGIPIEGLEDFAKTFKVCRFGRLPDVSYNPPSEEVLQATLAAWEALPDGNVFRTIGMALAFGLRAMEISQAKWSWFNTRNGYPVLDSTGDAVRVKGKTGMVQVRALDPFYTILRAKAQPARGEVTVLNGTPDTVNVNTFIGVSSWLKALGWKTLRHTHALRAYAGSLIAMRYSMYEAQIFLRHSSVVITEGHYSYFVKKFRPANLEDVPARWATTAAPELTILEGGAVVAG
jgi:integrase